MIPLVEAIAKLGHLQAKFLEDVVRYKGAGAMPEHLTKSGWAYFTADRLRFAFRRETLAVRYGLTEADSLTKATLRHLMFLTRRYASRAAQWLQRQTRSL
jgi:hypothetical protein